MTHLCYS